MRNYKEMTIYKASWQQNLHYSLCEANLLGFSFLPLPFWLHFWLFRVCFRANNGSSLPSSVNLLHMSTVFEVTFFHLWVDLMLTKRKVYSLDRQGERTPSKPPLAVLHTSATASQSRAKQPSSSPELLGRRNCQWSSGEAQIETILQPWKHTVVFESGHPWFWSKKVT